MHAKEIAVAADLHMVLLMQEVDSFPRSPWHAVTVFPRIFVSARMACCLTNKRSVIKESAGGGGGVRLSLCVFKT